tara:strand:- start:1615 stop:1920 length:306 start_codon:yes stop_codon:yes gene_type:complete
MILLLAFSTYFIVSLIISLLIRKTFKNKILKVLFFSLSLSIMLAIWFTYPGSNNISPAISIFLMSVFEDNGGSMRIFRSFFVTFVLILFIDSLLSLKKSKN